MIRAGLFTLMGVAVALAACSSDSAEKDKDKNNNPAAGGASFVDPGTGATGQGAAAATADGLTTLSADQAAQLTDPEGKCAGWVAEPEGGPAVLEFVVDTTSSLNDTTNPSTNGQTKWAVMQSALPAALAELPENWSIGLTFYCGTNCYQGNQDVPIDLHSAEQQAALEQAIRRRTVCTYTPSQAAWTFGMGQIQQVSSGNRYIVLVTDGVPTVNSDGCTTAGTGGNDIAISSQEYDYFVDTVGTETASTGIKTFVVGVAGSEDPQGAAYDPMYQLSRLADAGQTPLEGCTSSSGQSDGNGVNPRGTYCHFDLTQEPDFAAGLSRSIGAIGDSVVSCDYTVPPAENGQRIDPAAVNLVYNDGADTSYQILRNGNADCDRGWQFTDDTYTNIHICQITCDLLQANPLAKITAVFGCGNWTTVA